jgi:hypothetical protein
MRVVTTFNRAGLELYGKRMIASHAAHWPQSVPLVVYAEGFQLPGSRDLADVAWLQAFKFRNRERPFADFRFDAVRFAHKTAAVMDSAEQDLTRYLIWADGDTFAHADIPLEVLRGWVPETNQYISWLWRGHMYPECGFYIIDTLHRQHRELMAEWRRLYETDEVYRLPEQHDSYVLAHLVKTMGLGWKSLSGGFEDTAHPFVNGPLGQYMDHLKGPRKHGQRSHARDLRRRRDEPHWK